MVFDLRKQVFTSFLLCSILVVAESSMGDDEAGSVKIITGGYEAEYARINGTEIKGPRTSAVKAFMDQSKLPYSIESVVWGRAMRVVTAEPYTLIYPLTRTPEREDDFDWIKKIDTHTYHLLGKKSFEGQNLTKEQIISGKYFAICQEGTSNCSVLRKFGFPEASIIKVKAKNIQEMDRVFQEGRGSFTMDDIAIYNSDALKASREKIIRIGDFSYTEDDYLAGFKTDESLKNYLMGTGPMPAAFGLN
jgi:hypothetical protein